MSNISRVVLAAGLLATSAAGLYAQDEAPRRQYGVAFTGGVAGSPLGPLAGSYGLFALPGVEFGARLVTRSRPGGAEWGVGVLADEYSIEHSLPSDEAASFTYSSQAAILSRSFAENHGAVPVRYGLELGWRRFSARSTRANAFTDEIESSSVRAHAALFAITMGVELPSSAGFRIAPRARLESSYPDLGGGDGHSRLHSQRSMGIRASVGLDATLLVPR